jgi:transcriptional regulator with XRE-family HTH domain
LDYSKRLETIREAKGISQYRLSKLSGIPQATISRWEALNFNPTLEMLNKLCNALGVSVAEFVSGIDEEATNNEKFDALHQLIEEVPEDRRDEVRRFLEFTIQQHKNG